MGLTSKERQARYRARMRENKEVYDLQREKDRVRKALQRAKARNGMSKDSWDEHLFQEKLRLRKYRQKQKISPLSTQPKPTSKSAYGSKQALGKAIKRTQSSLPGSPEKRLCVVEAVAKSVGLTVKSVKLNANNHSAALDESTKELVREFYNNCDISWQAPGRKDRVIIREKDADGKNVKRTEQVRYMMMSLTEAYNIFNNNHPSIIGSSKFCELRPPNIKLFDHIPHNVCVCSYHENIRLLLVALKDHTRLSVEFEDFINQVTCDSSLFECMNRQCMECINLLDAFAPTEEENVMLRYQQWQTGDRVEKVDIFAQVQDAFGELQKQLKDFLIHTFVKRKQSAHMGQLISDSDGENIVLQVDFSENASIVSQNEIQSAHWGHKQATLFTAHAWIDTDIKKSIVLVSDNLNHTKHSVYVFMDYIMKELKSTNPGIKMINVFSDGASSQFKQRFLFSNLHTWEQEHNVKIRWNFFATSHGKGVVDGLGGTVKRSVWRQVKSGQSSVTTAKEYAQVAKQRNPNIHVKFISKEIIQVKVQELDAFWKGILAVPKTHQMHCIIPHGPDKVMVGKTSDAREFFLVPIRHSDDSKSESGAEEGETLENSRIGQWVVVKYDGCNFPGKITDCVADELKVNVMHKSGRYWKWPRVADNIFYKEEDVVKVIKPPTDVGSRSRGQFKFEDSF